MGDELELARHRLERRILGRGNVERGLSGKGGKWLEQHSERGTEEEAGSRLYNCLSFDKELRKYFYVD